MKYKRYIKKFMKNLILIFTLFSSCTRYNSENSNKIPTIDIVKFIDEKKETITLAEITTHIQEITLETTKESLVYLGGRMYYFENVFYLIGKERIQLFNTIGKYIGKFNETKEEAYYYNDLGNCFTYNDEMYLFSYNQQKLYVYSTEGNRTKTINVPHRIHYTNITSEGNFIGYQVNYSGTQNYQYILYNEMGLLLDSIIYLKEKQLEIITVLPNEVQFYRLNDNLYMKQLLSDTIYSIDNLPPTPHYIINMGKYKADPDIRKKMLTIYDNAYEKMKPLWVKGETNRYMFFQLGELPTMNIVFDKKDDKIYKLENPLNYKSLNYDLFFENGSYILIMQVAPDDEFFDENPILIVATIKE